MANLDESTQKAFDIASEITKQLILIASGVLAFTVTMISDNTRESASSLGNICLISSWISFTLSIGCGLMTMMSMAGNLQRNTTPSIDSAGIKLFSKFQMAFFIIAFLLTAFFGCESQPVKKEKNDKTLREFPVFEKTL